MSFMDLDLTNTTEPQSVPAGEYKLRILSAEKPEDKFFIRVRLEVIGPDDPAKYARVKEISHFIHLPKPEDDAKKTENKKMMVKRFLEAFDIPFDSSGFNLDSFPGQEGWAILSEREDERYGTQNEIERLIKRA